MNILLVAATEGEICPLLQHLQHDWRMAGGRLYQRGDHRLQVLITGVGMVATAYSLGKELSRRRYDLALQAGIAGSFDKGIPLGEVVFVASEQFGDLGAEDHDRHLDIFEMGLLQPDAAPFVKGRLDTPLTERHRNIRLRQVSGLTVNMVSGNERTIARLAERYSCQIESMEGAAFHYVCLSEDVPAFAQIRSISNYVTPRDRASWKMREAVTALNDWLIDFVKG
ncbi:MAG: futalosine hydrolase [Chitinophagaceae bacterium]|nr:MAG: futalosine hydrolase [Chitinophagaceae bacterium]